MHWYLYVHLFFHLLVLLFFTQRLFTFSCSFSIHSSIQSHSHWSVYSFVHWIISPCSPNLGEGSKHGKGDEGQADHGAQENGRGQQ